MIKRYRKLLPGALAVAFVLGTLGACGGGDGGDDGGAPPDPADAGPTDRLIAFDRDGDMWALDATTGVGTEVLDTTYNGVADVGVVSSSLYLTDQQVLWLGMGDLSECPACVMTLDFTTGAVTLLADNSAILETGVPGMGRSPFGGFIYLAKGNDRQFMGINPDTGIAQFIATMEPQAKGAGMTFTPDNVLYGALNNQLYTIDLATGAATSVGIFSFAGFPTPPANYGINSLTMLGNTMYGILYDRDSGASRTTYLVTIDPATALVTNVKANEVSMEGVATVPSNLVP